MSEKQKSLWVRVMEAGFGDTLKAHGFVKISPRLYRLEGEGLHWEEFTFQGVPTAENSFREGYGLVAHGAAEIYEAAYGKPLISHFGGRKFTKGWYGTIGIATEGFDAHEASKPLFSSLSAFRYNLRNLFRSTIGHYLDRASPYFELHYMNGAEYWRTGGDELERVAAELSKYWIRHIWKGRLEKKRTIGDVAEIHYGKINTYGGNFDPHPVVFNHLAGNEELARQFLMQPIHIANMTEREMKSFLLWRNPGGFRLTDDADRTDERGHIDYAVHHWMLDAPSAAERARNLAKALNYSVE